MSRTFVTRFAAPASLPLLLLLAGLASPRLPDPAGRPHPPLHHPHGPGRVGLRPTWRREWTRCTTSTPAGSRHSRPSGPSRSSEVYLFARQADYLHFTDDRLRNTGGVYIPKRNLLAAFLEGQGRDGLRRTLQHEAFHQFAYNAISPNLPVWLNEGLAQLFEEGIWNGRELLARPGPAAAHPAAPVRPEARQASSTSSRCSCLTSEQWAANLVGDHDLGATAIQPELGDGLFPRPRQGQAGQREVPRPVDPYAPVPARRAGRGRRFREAFSDNIRGFQDRFNEYAAALEPTSEATLMDRQGVLGDLLAELAKRGRRFTSFTLVQAGRPGRRLPHALHQGRAAVGLRPRPPHLLRRPRRPGPAPRAALLRAPRRRTPSPTSSAATPTSSSSAPASTPGRKTSSNTRCSSNQPISVEQSR